MRTRQVIECAPLLCCLLLAMVAVSEQAPVSHCQLLHIGERFVGTCGRLFNQTPTLTLARAAAITTGTWSDDRQPSSIWAGNITEENSSNEPLELEIYSGGQGILRTMYGWFAVTNFTSAPALSFDLDSSREVPPNALDRRIVERAAAILSADTAWNRADNRKCPADAKTWSIYCAMEKATREVTGGFHHRRPAMEFVRQIVEERSLNRNYHHRLMDYNNDSSTHLADVQSLFQEALGRMRQP